jgi:hypothetical protein
MYRVRTDGTGLRKAFDEPVNLALNVSPDGKWLQAWAPLAGKGTIFQVFSLEGERPVTIGSSMFLQWALNNNSVSIGSVAGVPLPEGRMYVVPVQSGRLPPIPAGGFQSEDELARLPGARRMDLAPTMSDVTGTIAFGPSPAIYAFYRGRAQRNLYRIPIP